MIETREKVIIQRLDSLASKLVHLLHLTFQHSRSHFRNDIIVNDDSVLQKQL